MTYLEEYKEGNKFSGIYLCKSKDKGRKDILFSDTSG